MWGHSFHFFVNANMLTHLIYRRIAEVLGIVLKKGIKARIEAKVLENGQLTIERLLISVLLIKFNKVEYSLPIVYFLS